jgi:hypothetical protein
MMVAVLEGFAPPENAGVSPRDASPDYARAIDVMRQTSTPVASFGVWAAFVLAQVCPLLLCGIPRLMTSLPVERRAHVLDRMLTSHVFIIRELSMLLKIGASMALLGNPQLRAQSHYDASGPEQRHARRLAAKTLPMLPSKEVA